MATSKTAVEGGVGWQFDHSYARLPADLFTRLDPTPVKQPSVVVLNHALAQALGLDLSGLSDDESAALFTGNDLPQDAAPLAQAYGGHQFGHFSVLGDGRAHLLGEHLTPEGSRYDIQFKGSGRTPYSRRGDGRAALGPMLREYIISEALYGLGIPCTRSLAVATTGEPVYREEVLEGAILTRVAASHLRVGTFEYVARLGDQPTLEALAHYAMDRHAPDALEADVPALALLKHVMDRQIDLIVHWMRVGFIHGVMNTDNMTISGEAIDFGPCAFMDAYDPATVFSSIDYQGRYAFANQPRIANWNLARLAEALLPLMGEDRDQAIKQAEAVIHGFPDEYETRWLAMMRGKLGLATEQSDDAALVEDLLAWMHKAGADYTNTFRALMTDTPDDEGLYKDRAFQEWHGRWQSRLDSEGQSSAAARTLMRQNNPVVVPRNHLVEAALTAGEQGDLSPMQDLLAVLADPYTDRPGLGSFTSPPPPDQRVYQTFCGT